MINGGDYDRIRAQKEKEKEALSQAQSEEALGEEEKEEGEEENNENDQNETGILNVNERKNFEAFNREILGLNPPITATSTNVSSNDLKSHNMATARGCAILQNSHRLNQNMKQV